MKKEKKLCWISLGRFEHEETAAVERTAPSKETIRSTLFLLLPTIKHHCVEPVAACGILLHVIFSWALAAAVSILL